LLATSRRSGLYSHKAFPYGVVGMFSTGYPRHEKHTV
jgi:hypothetical protein